MKRRHRPLLPAAPRVAKQSRRHAGHRAHPPRRALSWGPDRDPVRRRGAELPRGRSALEPHRPRARRPRASARARTIALLLDNGLHSLPCDFGCVKAGLVRTPLNGRLSLEEQQAMIEKIGAGTLIYGAEPGRARRRAQGGAARASRPRPRRRRGRAGSARASPTAPRTPIRACRIEPDDVTLALFTSGTTGTLKAAQHTPGELRRGGPQRPVQPDRPEARRDHAPRRLDDPRQRHLRAALLAARRHRGDPARLHPRFLSRGDRALAARPRSTSSRPCCRCCSSCPASTTADLSSRRDHPLRRLADAAPGAREGARALGPGLRPILRPDRSAARHLRASSKADHVGASRPSACSPAAARAIECELRLVDEEGEDAAARRARRDRAARALRDEGLYRRRAERGEPSSPAAGCAPATSAASTTRAI